MTIRFCVGAIAVAALGLGVSTANASETWRVTGGSTTFELATGLLKDIGFEVGLSRTTAKPRFDMPSGYGFSLGKDSTLMFAIDSHRFVQFQSGRLTHNGSLSFKNGKKTAPLSGFTIQPKGQLAQMGLNVQTGKGQPVSLDINYAKVFWDAEKKQLMIGYADLVITPEWARSMGRPDLAGQLIGQATVLADAAWSGGDRPQPFKGWGDPGGEPDVPVDVSIVELYGITSYGHSGTYPNGMNGFSMATTSCNPGDVNIPWYAPMDERHPVIAMHMYRVKNGRFEQIGQSWLKHGFFALNNNQCGSCNNPGTGSLLGRNCSDTYSAGNNASQFYLGGRDEVNPFTGQWTCSGSWFSNYVADCSRRNNGSGLAAIDHRLQVLDADLGNPNSTYYYEAYYITKEDTNKYNNIASRTISSMNWTGSQWTFSTSSEPIRSGPAITRWGDMNAIATPRDEGDAILAVDTTDLGNGRTRFEYALYVHDIDRQIREFSIPVGDSIVVTNIGFRDIDQDGGNNWAINRSSGKITWSTGTVGQTGANPLKYGTVFNFWFEATSPALDSAGGIGLFKSGSLPGLSVATKGPIPTSPPMSMTIRSGNLTGGSLADVLTSNNQYATFLVNTASETIYEPIAVDFESVAPVANPSQLHFVIEAGVDFSVINRRIYLFDFVAAQWVLMDDRVATLGDSSAKVSVTSNASRFVQAGTLKVLARTGWELTSADSTQPWHARIDYVAWQIHP